MSTGAVDEYRGARRVPARVAREEVRGADAAVGGLGPALAGRLPAILAEVKTTLEREHPDYARFLSDEFEGVVAAARGFVSRVLERPHRSTHSELFEGDGPEQALFERIGRVHRQQGQDVTGLLAAYRAGATVAWRHIVDEALHLGAPTGLGVPTESIAALATLLFAAVDHLSAASLRGYLREESADGRNRQRWREELVELLLSERCDTAALQTQAARAGWALPARAAVVLSAAKTHLGGELPSRLGEGCLWRSRSGMLLAIVPDADGPGRRGWLSRVLGGVGAVVGECGGLSELPASLPVAQLALAAGRDGILTDDPLFVDEHLDALIVHRDEALLATLRRRSLAPLDDLGAASRERLVETLRSWLKQMGNRHAMAAELQIHPQTVRYRFAQLRVLFGTELDDPARRAALVLALGWDPSDKPPLRYSHPDEPARSARCRERRRGGNLSRNDPQG